MLLVLPSPPPPPNTCRLGLAPGPGGYSATGAGACPATTKVWRLPAFKKQKKDPAAFLHPAQPPSPPPTQALHGLFGG